MRSVFDLLTEKGHSADDGKGNVLYSVNVVVPAPLITEPVRPGYGGLCRTVRKIARSTLKKKNRSARVRSRIFLMPSASQILSKIDTGATFFVSTPRSLFPESARRTFSEYFERDLGGFRSLLFPATDEVNQMVLMTRCTTLQHNFLFFNDLPVLVVFPIFFRFARTSERLLLRTLPKSL